MTIDLEKRSLKWLNLSILTRPQKLSLLLSKKFVKLDLLGSSRHRWTRGLNHHQHVEDLPLLQVGKPPIAVLHPWPIKVHKRMMITSIHIQKIPMKAKRSAASSHNNFSTFSPPFCTTHHLLPYYSNFKHLII